MMTAHNFKRIATPAFVFALAIGRTVFAQDPALTYRPPRIALVQPAEGGTLQQDKPAIVFRFVAGEPNDPVDVRSFAISVDAKDLTNLFQVSATEAWGLLTADPSNLSLGTHEIAARICSTRGACSSTTTSVTVSKPTVVSGQAGKEVTKKRRILDALLSALRALLKE